MGKKENKRRKLNAKQDDLIDDKIIKNLEKKLKLKNKKKPSKSLPKSFVCDGLDYILEVCDEDTRKIAAESEKQLANQSDDDDEFDLLDDDSNEDLPSEIPVKRKKAVKTDENNLTKSLNTREKFSSESDDTENESEFDEHDNEDSNFCELQKNTNKGKKAVNLEDKKSVKTHNKKTFVDSDNECGGIIESVNKSIKTKISKYSKNQIVQNKKRKLSSNDSEDEHSEDEANVSSSENEIENSENSDSNSSSKPEDDVWEDIYGRKRTKDGKIVTENQKYISPALRSKNLENSSEKNEKLLLLRRQLKGLLNRLAESNMHSIISQLDELYMSNSRNNMNELLTTLMLESIVAPVLTAERLVIEHMMCIAILHANVGTEIGAHFIMTLVKKFNEMIAVHQEVENKELDNLVMMISQLYNFKVFGSNLIYQIIEKLMDKFSEKEIELILLILKTAGLRMRKDDPLALKELVLNIQKKAAAMKSSNSRVQFMLDVLLAIKNNNMNKIPQYDQSYIEHLKKILKTLIRKGNTVSQLNLTLQDLLNADERGKWWIVGSAWSGKLEPDKKSTKVSDEKPVYSKKILELARAQRMNTDIRKNIFCILMTAEDYLDAFEKLHHLGLKERQEREIVYVILNCCLQEKKFNPYYAVLLQKFCEYERKYQMTIQYTLWDKLKMLSNYSSLQILNMAKLMSRLFIHNALPISILKVIQLGELDPLTLKLYRKIMLEILLHDNTETCLQVFSRIAPSEKLNQFKEGLRLFMNYFLLKKMKKDKLSEKQKDLLNRRIELADRILMTSISKVSF